jgi:thiamine pyrophosphate-dependent acetolactate synthase large subunit-like protein
MDFVALAQGHGLPAIRVSQAADLDEALKNGLTADGPILLEVAVERH